MKNIVITGASGWLGRATIRALSKEFGTSILNEISAFGNSHRVISIPGVGDIRVQPLLDLPLLNKCDYLFHFAFLTRDQLLMSDKAVYQESNEIIRNTVSTFIQMAEPKALAFCSSGAVAYRTEKQEQDLSYSIYAEMKLREQEALVAAANSCGTSTVMCTLFSATGIDMVEPTKYAIGSLVQQALFGKELVIEAKGTVFRKYVDSEILMQLIIKLSMDRVNVNFDSGGNLVELSELATIINFTVGNGLNIVRPNFTKNSPIDDYFSKSNLMEEMFHAYGIKSLSLESQIANVIESVKILDNRLRQLPQSV